MRQLWERKWRGKYSLDRNVGIKERDRFTHAKERIRQRYALDDDDLPQYSQYHKTGGVTTNLTKSAPTGIIFSRRIGTANLRSRKPTAYARSAAKTNANHQRQV